MIVLVTWIACEGLGLLLCIRIADALIVIKRLWFLGENEVPSGVARYPLFVVNRSAEAHRS